MRIFHLAPNMNYGGLQTIVRLLALNQAQAGHTVTVGCWANQSNHPEAERELEQNGVRIVHLRRAMDGGMESARMLLLGRLKGYLGRGNTDILHVHNPFGYYLYGAMAARAARGTRVVNTVHFTAMFDHPLFGRKGRSVFWSAAMLSDAIISVCTEVDAFMRNRFFLPGLKYFVVDNGIDLRPFLAVPARRLREEVVFGFAARMAPEKNHRMLLDAFALTYREHRNIRLRLLGGGALEPALRRQAIDLGIQDVVEFRGFSHDVAGFFCSLDVFVSPSSFEGLPLGLLEAIASGLPVVATAVDSVPRIVRSAEAGWVCPPNDPEALMSIMEKALVAEDRITRGERARTRIAEYYSAERMSKDYEQVYRTLVQ